LELAARGGSRRYEWADKSTDEHSEGKEKPEKEITQVGFRV